MNTDPVEIATATIFSKEFKNAYGFKFSNQIKAASKLASQSLFRDNDYSCYDTYQDILVNKGKITAISNDNIEVVTENNNTFKLVLLACSKIDRQINAMPNIGSKIIWKGFTSGDNVYLHTATLI